MRLKKKVSYVFDVEVMVENTSKEMVTSHVMHVVTLAYKATIAGSWSKPPTGKKLVALLSRVCIIF
jgi:phosphoribosyl 1,2-cyclic phosphodiesterase